MTVCLQAVSKHPGFKTKTKGLVPVESGLVGDSGVKLPLQWSTRISVYTRNPLKEEGQAGVSGWEMAAQGLEG